MQEAETPPLVLVSSSRVVKPRRSSSSISTTTTTTSTESNRTDTEPGSIIRLSTCDLALPNVYAMAIFAFRGGPEQLGDVEQVDVVERLEKGLSQALDEYPEWAGRLRERIVQDGEELSTVIELTDEGVVLIDATMTSTTTQLNDLMPFDPSPLLFSLVPDTQNVEQLLLVQVTRFNCGGFVLGVAWHHRLADGQAFFAFMDNWSRITRRTATDTAPFHDRSALLLTAANDHSPPSDDYLLLSPPPSPPRRPPPLLQAKKFHFSTTELSKLRQEARSSDQQPITRFVALTAHLWRCITRARSLDASVSTRIMIPMDGRSRLRPRLPLSYFGNATFAPWTSKVEAGQLLSRPLSFAAKLVRDAIVKADDGYLRSALELMRRQQRRSSTHQISFELSVPPGMSPDVCVSSWVRFPLYDVDFGVGGSPLFVGNVLQLFEGIMVLLPSYTRDGSIDAVVALEQPAMAELELELGVHAADSSLAQR